jgi:hypothetical protein
MVARRYDGREDRGRHIGDCLVAQEAETNFGFRSSMLKGGGADE